MILLKKLVIPLILFVLIFFAILGYTFFYYSKNLPNIEEITEYKPKTITKIYDRNDLLYGLFFDEKREYRNIDKIPLLIRNAFISAEDKNFFKHSGFDPIGYLKALISFIKEGKLRGASTITQQVTKGFLLSGERTFERKIKELILALRLEDALSKNKILEIYLNEVYLGENSYGVVAASKTYFSKDLDELTPGEAAFLAALPKSPKQYNPKVNIFNAVNRRNFVLKEMYQNGYLEKKIKDAEIKKDLIININNISNVQKNYKLLEGFIADEIRSDIQKLFGSGFLSRGGLSITTSINNSMQQKSNDLLIKELSLECGYNSSSIRERIYVNTVGRNHMAGILIYTSDGDSEGSLGGLVRLGKPGNFERIIKKLEGILIFGGPEVSHPPAPTPVSRPAPRPPPRTPPTRHRTACKTLCPWAGV